VDTSGSWASPHTALHSRREGGSLGLRLNAKTTTPVWRRGFLTLTLGERDETVTGFDLFVKVVGVVVEAVPYLGMDCFVSVTFLGMEIEIGSVFDQKWNVLFHYYHFY